MVAGLIIAYGVLAWAVLALEAREEALVAPESDEEAV